MCFLKSLVILRISKLLQLVVEFEISCGSANNLALVDGENSNELLWFV